MYKKILLAMDGSEDAERASKRLLELSKKMDAEIIAFHSIEHHYIPVQIPTGSPIANTYSIGLSEPIYQELRDAYITRGKKILQKTKELFKQENITIETRLIENSKPYDYIKKSVNEEHFDFIVLGCKGAHSKVEELLLGSVAQKVLNRIPVDVLVVR